MFFIKMILSLALLFIGFNAIAASCTQNNNQLTSLVGLDAPNGGVFAFIKSEKNECECTYVRFQINNTDTQAALGIVTAAKLADKKVRVDFLNKGDCNSGYRVYIE